LQGCIPSAQSSKPNGRSKLRSAIQMRPFNTRPALAESTHRAPADTYIRLSAPFRWAWYISSKTWSKSLVMVHRG
jgi:hypothetical protein